MNTLELHPLCTLFPRLVGAEFEALKADIATHGQHEPITVYEGQILDGGNRYRACVEAGIEPVLKEFTGIDPASFALSANMHRRHLAQGQMAAIVAGAQDWSRAQTAGGDRRSDHSATLRNDSAADRAVKSGASLRTQQMADKVTKADPELAKRVRLGEISLPKALEELAPKQSTPSSTVAVPASRVTLGQQVQQQSTAKIVPDSEEATSHIDPSDEVDPFDQLRTEYDEVLGERDRLKARNAELEALLAQNDLAAQVDYWKSAFEGMSSRNAGLIKKLNIVEPDAESQREALKQIRLALGVERNSDIVPALKARRAA